MFYLICLISVNLSKSSCVEWEYLCRWLNCRISRFFFFFILTQDLCQNTVWPYFWNYVIFSLLLYSLGLGHRIVFFFFLINNLIDWLILKMNWLKSTMITLILSKPINIIKQKDLKYFHIITTYFSTILITNLWSWYLVRIAFLNHNHSTESLWDTENYRSSCTAWAWMNTVPHFQTLKLRVLLSFDNSKGVVLI